MTGIGVLMAESLTRPDKVTLAVRDRNHVLNNTRWTSSKSSLQTSLALEIDLQA